MLSHIPMLVPQGSLTNCLSGHTDDRWYELLEPSDTSDPPRRDSPPPLPARLGSTCASAFQLVTPNGKALCANTNTGPVHHNKVCRNRGNKIWIGLSVNTLSELSCHKASLGDLVLIALCGMLIFEKVLPSSRCLGYLSN